MKIPRVSPATLVLALLAALAFLLPALRPVSDADVWWHLEAGENTLAGGSAAFTESWSFTAAGRPWINHEWLAEWRLALARRSGGDAAVVVFAGFVLFITALLLFRAARLEGLPAVLILPVLAFVPLSAGSRFVPRPQVFTYLFLALLFERLAAARRRERPPGLLFLAVFPLIQVLWTNMHGPVIGLGVGALLVLGGAIPALSVRGRLALTGSLILASVVHPQGWRAAVEYIPHLVGGGLYNQTIQEWLPLLNPGPARMPESIPTWLLIAIAAFLGVTGLVRPGSRRHIGYAILLLGLAVAPVTSVRHRDLLAMAFVPAAAVIIMSWRHRAPAGTAPRAGIPSGEWRIDRRLGAPLIALSLMFLAVPAFGFLGYPRAWPPDPRLDTNHFPVDAANFLEKEPVGSRIFNAYDYGGYLIDRLAPKRKVFIDGRYFVYGEAIYRDYLEIRDGGGNARALLDRYRADLLLVRYPEPDGYQGLAAEVRAWTGWSLVFWDDISLLYVKDSAATREWLSKHAYGWLDPTLPPAMEDVAYWRIHFQNLLSEAGRAQAEAPNAVRPLLVEALACEYNGLDGDAASAYEAILKRHPGNRPANDGLKRIRSRHPGGIPAPTMKGER